MSTICEIKFVDRENGVFFPGEILRCSVQLITTKPKTLQEISVLVSGKSKVRWTENVGKHRTTYRNELIYFTSKSILHKDPEAENLKLCAGTHSYNFEIQLPDELPSSYQGQFGENHYEVKLTLSRAWRFDNEFVQPFTMICPIDLNKNIELKNPTSEVGEEKLYLFCCSIEPIRIKVGTPHSGYIPGQSIPISLEVSNLSKSNCDKIVVKLHRHSQFLVDSPRVKTKYSTTIIMKIELPGVPKSSNKSFSTNLLVPPTAPSSPPIFDIIKIWYSVNVEAFMGFFHQNLKMFVPITIGTIPLVESKQNSVEPSSADVPNAPILTHMSSFKESQPENKAFVDKDRDKFIEYGNFIPKYPVFNDPQGETSPNY